MLSVVSPSKTSAIFFLCPLSEFQSDANVEIRGFSMLIEPFAQGKYTL